MNLEKGSKPEEKEDEEKPEKKVCNDNLLQSNVVELGCVSNNRWTGLNLRCPYYLVTIVKFL